MNKPAATAKREIWNKVRWINIAGVSYDVISELALRYDLHPLSLEDVLHGRKNARSKADYYTKHLFVHVLAHTLGKQEDDPDELGMLHTDEPKPIMSTRTSSTYVNRNEVSELDDGRQGSWMKRRSRMSSSGSGTAGSSGWYDGKDLEQRAGMGEGQRKKPLFRNSLTPSGRAKAANQQAIEELKKGFGRVYVQVASIWIFLLRDGECVRLVLGTH